MEMGLSPVERQLMDQAIEFARSLNRPFTEREVLAHARQAGYALRLCFDPHFKKISERQGYQFPLWIVDAPTKDELTARLNELKVRRVDCHVRVKQLYHEIDESFHWYDEYKPLRIQEIRLKAQDVGIDPQQQKKALIEALVAYRVQVLKDQIAQVQETIAHITAEICKLNKSN